MKLLSFSPSSTQLHCFFRNHPVGLECSRSVAPCNTPRALFFFNFPDFLLCCEKRFTVWWLTVLVRDFEGQTICGWSLRAQLFLSSLETRLLVWPKVENTRSARDSKSSQFKSPFIVFCRFCLANNPLSIFSFILPVNLEVIAIANFHVFMCTS